MPAPRFRTVVLIEVLSFCALVAWYIWQLQTVYKYSWIVFPIWLVASFLIHRDTLKTLGWRADNLWPAVKLAAVVIIPQVVGLVILGGFLGTLHRSVVYLLARKSFVGYTSFCLVQQIALNSYVTNRLLSIL